VYYITTLNCLMWVWPCIAVNSLCGNKMPTRWNRWFIYCRSYCLLCFGHHYAHHQQLNSIIQWLLPVVFGAVRMEDVIHKLNDIRVFWVLSGVGVSLCRFLCSK